MGGFSFASVILSYFLVAGGLLTGTLVAGKLGVHSEAVGLALWAAGSFVGGFFAARASRGSTIIEPAIGAVLVVATGVLAIIGTSGAKELWHAAPEGAGKAIGELVGTVAVGALAGAFVSEKVLGEATVSGLPWFLYSALATFGATFLATTFAVVLFMKSDSSTTETLAKMMLAGVGIGSLLAGLAIGASARLRVILASLFGGAIGIAGFFALMAALQGGGRDKDTVAGIAVFAVGGAIVTMIGAALGWTAIGKRSA